MKCCFCKNKNGPYPPRATLTKCLVCSDSSSGPFGSSLLNMAKAAQQQCNNGTHTATIEIEEIESIEHISTPNSSLDIKPDPDDGLDPIERIAAKTGTLQTLQKMRTGMCHVCNRRPICKTDQSCRNP